MAGNKGPLLLGLAALGGLAALMFSKKGSAAQPNPNMKGGVDIKRTSGPNSPSPVVNDLYNDLSQDQSGPSTANINQDPLPSPVQQTQNSTASANQPNYPPSNWGVPNQRGGTEVGPGPGGGDVDPDIIHD